MKKILSVLLATLMLFSTVFVGISVTAEPEVASVSPIEATPITEFTKGNDYYDTYPTSTVTPLGWVASNGIKIQANEGQTYVGSDDVNSHNWYHTRAALSSETTFGSETALIIYVKTESANILVPKISTLWEYVVTPKMGATYYYAETGEKEWKEGIVEKAGAGVDGSNYHGALVFDSAFEGYIKINLTDLGHNEIGSIKSGWPLTNIYLGFKGLGGEYGDSIISGPYFLVNKDSSSTEIVVSDEFKPTPIKATPIVTTNKGTGEPNYTSITEVMPLGFTTAKGLKVTAKSSDGYTYDSAAAAFSNLRVHTSAPEGGTWFTGNTILLYIEVPTANEVYLQYYCGATWVTRKFVAGSEYQYFELGASSWSTGTVTENNVLSFNDSFKGFVKLSLSANLGAGSNSKPDYFQLSVKSLGGAAGSVVLGPLFNVTEDGNSTVIEVPDEYKPSPIEAKPTPNAYTFHPLGSVKVSEVFPTNLTSAKGAKLTCGTEKVAASSAANAGSFGFYIRPESNTKEKWFDTDSIIMYVKTDAANEICPRIADAASGSWWRELIAGTDYQYLEKGSNEWKTATVKSVTVDDATKGVIEFDKAFDGYIKFNIVTNFNISNATKFRYFYVYPKALGGQYGSVTIAPIFSVTKDSNSTQIKVPEEYKPSDIKVNPITNYKRTNYYSGTVTLSDVESLDYTSAKGIKLVPSNGAYTKPSTAEYASSAVRTTVNMVIPYAIDGMEAFVLYLDIPSANTVYPMFTVDAANLSYNVTMALKPGTIYYTLANGDTEWKEHTVGAVCSCGSASVHGGMVFDSAFKGYVKFNPQNITCGDISAPGKGAYIDRIDICFEKIDSAMIAGPYFSATSDSISTNITVNKVIGDINKDAVANDTDVTVLRSYLIGVDNKFASANGNITEDAEGVIDITDLVKLAGIIDDIVFSSDAYYLVDKLSTDVKTVSAYVCIPESINNDYTAGTLFGSNNGTAANYLNFGIGANGKPVFANGTDTLTFDGNVQTGDWVHLVYVIDDLLNTATVYLNGVSLGSQAISGYTSVKNMTFVLGGDAVNGNVNYFKGNIGEVALYSTALTSGDVAEIYAAGTAANADIALWDVASTVTGKKIVDKVGNNDLNAYTTFFDEKDAVTDYAYSFAVVGDTQTITASGQPEHLSNIYDWIIANKTNKKIEFVMGLGDITDGNQNYEWENAQKEVSKLNGVIPYTVVRGNHDSVSKINTYFGTDAYIGQFKDGAEYYGFYVEDESDIRNSYRTFTTSTGVKYLILTLDFGPYDDVLTWADSVLSDEKFANHKVVITTHAYLYSNGTTLDANEDGAATGYKYNGDSVAKIATNEDPEWSEKTNNGDDIYTKLVSKHDNIVLVLSGHIINDKIVYRQDTYANGNVVTQMLIDPQGVDGKYNGVGLVALLYFSNDGNTITVEYYSTVKEQYFLRDNQFTIDISANN